MRKLSDLIEKLELIHERLKLSLPRLFRPYFQNLKIENLRGVIIYGQRGVGKTTFLLSKTKNLPFLYVSVDHPLVSDVSLYELGEAVFKSGYKGIILDEVQYAKDWAIHLKALYDSFPECFIWASGSSSLILKTGSADFSRRFIFKKIPLLSFREYLFLTSEVLIEPVDIFDLKLEFLKRFSSLELLQKFRHYLRSGTRPFFQEGAYCERLKAVLEKAIFHDIPLLLPSIKENHLKLLRAVVGHLLFTPVPVLNISSLCRDWQIGKEKLYELLFTMESAEIIKLIRKKRKDTGYTKGAKILLTDVSFYYCFEGNLGTAREAFSVYNLCERYGEVLACPNDMECDYVVKNLKIEIGGKNKKPKNADLVVSDEVDLPVKNKVPLYILGLLY